MNNCISKICPNIEGIGLLRPWTLKEKRTNAKALLNYGYFVNIFQNLLSPIFSPFAF
jgi:hypothetical protein